MFILVCWALQVTLASAQGFYIAPTANLFVHNDSLSIFSNVSNSGNFGSKPGAVIHFMGLLWNNDTSAMMPDEYSYPGNSSIPTMFNGMGGLFWISNSPNFPQPQLLTGGYTVSLHTGPGFPNLRIDNNQGVFMSGGMDMQVRNVLNLANGKLWVNGNNLLLGALKPGTITGYNENKYIVTGTGTSGGFLYRAMLDSSGGQTIFPVGADTIYYTPAAITYKGVAQNFKVRPFNQVISHAVSGSVGNQSFVQTTWNIGKENRDTAETDLVLQHPQFLEGSLFSAKRDSSYITHYDSTRQVWDTVPASGVYHPGRLTTGNPQDSSFENVRALVMALSSNEYFAKTFSINSSEIAKIGIANNVNHILAHEDGSFDIDLSIVVQNQGKNDLQNVLVSNDLLKTFLPSFTINVLSLKATGSLIINTNYNGLSNGDTLLLQLSSKLAFSRTDTINLLINVNPGSFSGTYYNQSNGFALTTSTAYKVNCASVNGMDPSGIPGKTPITLRKLKVHIPGGFSPNNDGANDKFVLDSTANYNISMEVFNRWGQKVYKSKGNYNNDWDGTCNQPGPFINNKLDDGTYYYFIILTDKQSGEISKAVGFLTLRR